MKSVYYIISKHPPPKKNKIKRTNQKMINRSENVPGAIFKFFESESMEFYESKCIVAKAPQACGMTISTGSIYCVCNRFTSGPRI